LKNANISREVLEKIENKMRESGKPFFP